MNTKIKHIMIGWLEKRTPFTYSEKELTTKMN